MQVYQKKSDTRSQLEPLRNHEDAIPKSIRDQVGEERDMETMRRFEKEYLRIYLTTHDLVKGPTGPGCLLYTKYNWDPDSKARIIDDQQKRVVFYYSKSLKFIDFCEELSKSIGIKLGGFFLWKYTERKNWLIPLLNMKSQKDQRLTLQKMFKSEQSVLLYFLPTNPKNITSLYRPLASANNLEPTDAIYTQDNNHDSRIYQEQVNENQKNILEKNGESIRKNSLTNVVDSEYKKKNSLIIQANKAPGRKCSLDVNEEEDEAYSFQTPPALEGTKVSESLKMFHSILRNEYWLILIKHQDLSDQQLKYSHYLFLDV